MRRSALMYEATISIKRRNNSTMRASTARIQTNIFARDLCSRARAANINSKGDMSPSEFFQTSCRRIDSQHPRLGCYIGSATCKWVAGRVEQTGIAPASTWLETPELSLWQRQGGREIGTWHISGRRLFYSRKSGLVVRFRFVEFNPSPRRNIPRTCVRLAPAFRHSFSPPSALATGSPAGFGFLLLDDVAAGIRDSVCTWYLYVDRITERSSKSLRDVSKREIFSSRSLVL